jgi:CheY-like chemotaxis protein
MGKLATILVVDDEPGVLDVSATMLENSGFVVVAVGSAEEALAVLRSGGTVDLLVTDVLMPRITGYELAREAKAMRPALKVLYISGYDSGPHTSDRGEKFGDVLWKPYRLEQFMAAVHGLLSDAAED